MFAIYIRRLYPPLNFYLIFILVIISPALTLCHLHVIFTVQLTNNDFVEFSTLSLSLDRHYWCHHHCMQLKHISSVYDNVCKKRVPFTTIHFDIVTVTGPVMMCVRTFTYVYLYMLHFAYKCHSVTTEHCVYAFFFSLSVAAVVVVSSDLISTHPIYN